MKALVQDGKSGHLHLQCEPGDTDQLRRIVGIELPRVLAKFAAKNTQYGEASFDLGIRGQFADMHRKYVLLRKAMWDNPGEPLEFEPLEEILGDFIGHILMTLDMLSLDRNKIFADTFLDAVLSEPESELVAHGEDGEEIARSFPANWKGRHTYQVRESVGGKLFTTCRGRALLAAGPTDPRCGVYFGDNFGNSVQRCAGVAGHTNMEWDAVTHPDMPANRSEDRPWGWHINDNYDMWRE